MTAEFMEKIAVLTGDGGVGRAVAVPLARADGPIAAAGRTAVEVDEMVAQLETDGHGAVSDVSAVAQVGASLAKVVAYCCSVVSPDNVACVTAGDAPIGELDADDGDWVMAISGGGAYHCARATSRHMRRRENGARVLENGPVSVTTSQLFSARDTASEDAPTGLSSRSRSTGDAPVFTAVRATSATSAQGDATATGVARPDGSNPARPGIGAASVRETIVSIAEPANDTIALTINVMANEVLFAERG